MLEAGRPLAEDDPECTAVLLDALTQEGIVIRSGVVFDRIERTSSAIRVTLATGGKPESIDGSHVLVAAGRDPNLVGLDLAAAGIRSSPDGIVLDHALRTTNQRVYAIGDVAGGPHRAHVAAH